MSSSSMFRYLLKHADFHLPIPIIILSLACSFNNVRAPPFLREIPLKSLPCKPMRSSRGRSRLRNQAWESFMPKPSTKRGAVLLEVGRADRYAAIAVTGQHDESFLKKMSLIPFILRSVFVPSSEITPLPPRIETEPTVTLSLEDDPGTSSPMRAKQKIPTQRMAHSALSLCLEKSNKGRSFARMSKVSGSLVLVTAGPPLLAAASYVRLIHNVASSFRIGCPHLSTAAVLTRLM